MENGKHFRHACRVAIIAALIALLACARPSMLFGQANNAGLSHPQSGEQIYNSACVACHGDDGKGTPQSIRGFEAPDSFPDFTRCDQTTAEENSDWKAVITYGGQYRGFSQIMPAFNQALTSEQIDDVIKHLRSFCRNP
jgi:mono/diheme cytochrome c family protein